GAELVELLRSIARDAARQHLGLPERDRQRQALQRDQRLAERGAPVDSVPARQEAAERGLLGRLDLAAKRRERRAAEAAQHIRVAPLALDPAGAELAADELVRLLEPAQQNLDVDAEPLVRLPGREGAASARVARHELLERGRPSLEERIRQP